MAKITTSLANTTEVVHNNTQGLNDGDYIHLTQLEKDKFDGIETGAEVNVNADWNSISGDSQILNKPLTFEPSPHTHPISDIVNLQTNLDNKVDENLTIIGGTKTKITYDSKGLVTNGVDATTSDINDSINRRYVTDSDIIDINNLSGINTGDQISIVGITGTKSQFNTSLTDGDFLYVGDVTNYTDEQAQDAVGNILTDSGRIAFAYSDATPSIYADIVDNSIGATKLADNINISEFVNDSSFETTTQLNVRDTNNRNRANHTGTQLSTTISDFTSASRTASVEDQIVDGVTSIAPSQNIVFDNLALKENTANKQNNLTPDGTGTKFPTVDAVNSGLNSSAKYDWFLLNATKREDYMLQREYNSNRAYTTLTSREQNLSQVGDTYGHGAIIKLHQASTKLYVVSIANTVDTGDSATSVNCFVRLQILQGNTSGIINMPILSTTTIAKNGDVVGGKTIISGAGVPNAYIVGDILHIIWSAQANDGIWYEMHNTVNCLTDVIGTPEICTMESGLMNSAKIAAHLGRSDNAQISMNGTLTEFSGYYYSAAVSNTFWKNGAILRTTDFVNWEFAKEPSFTGITPQSQWEISLGALGSNMYMAIRQIDLDPNADVNSIILAKLDSSLNVVDWIEVPSGTSRPEFYLKGTTELYLVFPTDNRQNSILLLIDPVLRNSRPVQDIPVWGNYVSIAHRVGSSLQFVVRTAGSTGLRVSSMNANNISSTVVTTTREYISTLTSDVQTQINTKASIVSPTFTGNPTAPTATAGTNTTQIATTAFTTSADNLKENLSNKQNSLAIDGTGTKYPTVDAISSGTSYKITISQIRALTGTLPNNNFYTTDLGQQGNWYYDATDTTSADNTGTILVTADGKRIKRVINGKISPLWFGAKGDSTTDDTTAFQNAINYLATTFTNSESSAMATAELNRITLDLQGKAYLINSELTLPIIQTSLKIGGFSIEGGKLIIGDGLQAINGFLFHFTDAGKIVFQNLTIQGKGADSTNRNCFLIDGVSINVKILNVSGIDTNLFLRTSDTTFDLSVNECYVRTYSAPFPSVMVDVGGDAFFNNNFFIGCSTAISARLGGNVIRGNHFYGAQGAEPLGVVCSDNGSFGTIVSGNYFDGFGIKMFGYGQASLIEGNTFPNANVYSPIKLMPFSSVTLGKVAIKNNAIMYLSANTPVMTGVAFNYSFPSKQITLTGVENLTDKHLGSIIENNINQRIQIYSIIDSKNALVKTVSVNDFTTGSYTLDINPNPVFISNNETLTATNLRKNVFIFDNVVSMNTVSGFLNIYPLTIRSDSEYYNQVIKKVSQAYRIEGTEGITFNLPSDDFNNIKFQINGVTKGRIGTTSNFLRLASSTTSSRSLLLSDTVLRPEANNVLSLGTTSERFSNAFLQTLTLTAPTTSAGTYDFLTRDTSTGVVEKITSASVAPIASPALTGTPTAPTATAGTNTTQIATTAFVQGSFVNLTGNQSIIGRKSFTSDNITVGGINITNNRNITTGGTSDQAGLYISNTNTAQGILLDNSSSGNGIQVSNTGTGNGVSISNFNTGIGLNLRTQPGATGDLLSAEVGITRIQSTGRLSTTLVPASGNDVTNKTYVDNTIKSKAGWANYSTTTYTNASPFSISPASTVTLPNNANNSIITDLPLGVTAFYNGTTNKITPAAVGDSYTINVRFKAKTTTNNDYLTLFIDIGTSDQINAEAKQFLKGANTEQAFSFTLPIYTLSTFVTNGGLIKITSNLGTITVYDITYFITRNYTR